MDRDFEPPTGFGCGERRDLTRRAWPPLPGASPRPLLPSSWRPAANSWLPMQGSRRACCVSQGHPPRRRRNPPRGSVKCIEEQLAPSLITSPPAKPPASTGAAAFWHAIAPIMIPATPRAHSIRSCVRQEGDNVCLSIHGVACNHLCIRARTHRCLSGRRAKAFLHELGPQDLDELGHELCNLLLLSVILRIGGNRQQSLLIG